MSYTEVANINEFKVLQMSWVFDINFKPTFEILRQRDDLDLIVATLPESQLWDKALAFIKSYIDLRLEE